MNRLANIPEPIRAENVVRLFQRTMANWASDLLRRQPPQLFVDERQQPLRPVGVARFDL